MATTAQYVDALQRVIDTVVAPEAPSVDSEGRYPGDALDALGEAGILGLCSAADVGGGGLGLRPPRTSSSASRRFAVRPQWSSSCTMQPPRWSRSPVPRMSGGRSQPEGI